MLDASLLVLTLFAQNFEQRGYVETNGLIYPQAATNDSGHVVGNAILRWEPSYKFTPWLKISASFDAQSDSHRQSEREWRVDAYDRGILRPAFSVRRLSATLHKGKFTAEIGRQFIRWGKTDILNPTDRFAPKDYLASVVNSDFLGVAAARVIYEDGNNS